MLYSELKVEITKRYHHVVSRQMAEINESCGIEDQA